MKKNKKLSKKKKLEQKIRLMVEEILDVAAIRNTLQQFSLRAKSSYKRKK